MWDSNDHTIIDYHRYHGHKNLVIDRLMHIKIISPQLYLYINIHQSTTQFTSHSVSHACYHHNCMKECAVKLNYALIFNFYIKAY